MSEKWKELIIVPIYKKGDKQIVVIIRTQFFPAMYKILFNILLSKLIPYAQAIAGDYQCGFRRDRSATDHIFCIRQITEENWVHNEAVHQLFIDFKGSYVSVRREALYNILIQFCIPMKLVRLIKMCLNENYRRVRVGKHLSDMLPFRYWLKEEDDLSPLVFDFSLVCAFKRVQVNQDGLKLSGTHQLLVYADDVNILGGSVPTTKTN